MATQRTRKANGKGKREADRRKTILRAAIEVFSRKGYHGCRIADVAREAGVAYGLVYHYFRGKDELLESVFKSGWKAPSSTGRAWRSASRAWCGWPSRPTRPTTAR